MPQEFMYQMHYLGFDQNNPKKSVIEQMTEHLDYLAYLGIDYVWISPLTESDVDHGYGAVDHFRIDPRLGTNTQYEKLIKRAHQLGIKVIYDLVINHTSSSHPWFQTHPEYYYWATRMPIKNSGNIFDSGCCWDEGEYGRYFHCFAKGMPCLAYFPDGPNGKINHKLVQEIRNIVKHYEKNLGIDGFRIDAFQCINKDPYNFRLEDTLSPEYLPMAKQVIEKVFAEKNPETILIGELLDDGGRGLPYYDQNSILDYVMDTGPHNLTAAAVAKDQLAKNASLSDYTESINNTLRNCKKGVAANESHDTIRFTTAFGISGKEAIDNLMSFKDAKLIVFYQGQELGLENPKNLTIEMAKELDIGTELRLLSGKETEEEILRSSRANNRVLLPFDEWERQMADPDSCLNYTKRLIQAAKAR